MATPGTQQVWKRECPSHQVAVQGHGRCENEDAQATTWLGHICCVTGEATLPHSDTENQGAKLWSCLVITRNHFITSQDALNCLESLLVSLKEFKLRINK